MSDYFKLVKSYLQELDFEITHADADEEMFVISHESSGIKSMMISCADPILIMEQLIFEVTNSSGDMFKKLLQKNRDIVHGAFVLNGDGNKVIFRDTLQLENLDMNELEASIHSLSLLLTEYTDEIINFSKA